ncbi:MAG TPA: protein kinase [Ktedonobacterales bacterium]|nr:protein kinase [Ktedonobacterales bacterium]
MTMDAWNANALIGARLGSSTLERVLGVGGMGAVYLARQERPRRYVAVKVLRPGIAADENAWRIFLARFRREADAAAALDHGNIVPIYEFGEQGSIAYIVMPYLSDGSLANFLTSGARLSVEQTIAYLDQAAAALDYAHQHGIVHRDVKPSNLLLHPDGRLLLADFGIARPLNMADLPMVTSVFEGGDLTVSGAAMGTPEYMAPEQVRGETVSAATDTYALGVVAYTLLAGHTPFEGGDINQIQARQLHEMPPSLRSKRQDVPRDVEDAILWAMAKDPSHRPGSTGSFARALRAAGTGIPSTPSSFSTGHSAARLGMVAQDSPGKGLPILPGSTHAGVVTPPDGPDAPTLFDAVYNGGHGRFGTPAWPSTPSSAGAPPPAIQRRTLSIIALLGAAGVFLLTLAVVLASGSLGNLVNLDPNGTGNIVSHPTATLVPTATPIPSPTPVVNWLRVAPTQVTFGCRKNDHSVRVVLSNLGPESVDWKATKASPLTSLQISISPTSGKLDAGATKTITLTYSPGFIALNNSISFSATDNDQAGAPATVNYSAPACGFGGGNSASPGLSPQHNVKHGHKDGNVSATTSDASYAISMLAVSFAVSTSAQAVLASDEKKRSGKGRSATRASRHGHQPEPHKKKGSGKTR